MHTCLLSKTCFATQWYTSQHSARKSVVFVMDEFDALVRGGKQTVLYTLVDAMRHTQAQVGRHNMVTFSDHGATTGSHRGGVHMPRRL